MLNNDVLRRIFEFTISPDKNGILSIDSVSTLISLRNTCVQFREIIDSSRWEIKSIQIEENDVSSFSGRENSSKAGKVINLLSQHGILQVSEVNFNWNKLNRKQQVKFMADLSAGLKGKCFGFVYFW